MNILFILYKGNIYRQTENIFTTKDCFVTKFKEKTDDTFYEYLDHLERYARDCEDNEVDAVYDVDFYVEYHDTGRTMEMAAQRVKEAEEKGKTVTHSTHDSVLHHRWVVNEKRRIQPQQNPQIENNEVALMLCETSYSEDWVLVEKDKRFCSKVVDIHDCDKLLVQYTYFVRNGKRLDKAEVVEVTMEPEDFKAEMLKYRLSNI